MSSLAAHQRRCSSRLGGLAAIALLAAALQAQAQSPRVPFGQDNHAIRYILSRLNLQPLASARGSWRPKSRAKWQ